MINVTVIKPEVSYPKLCIHRTFDHYMIVLFTKGGVGIVVDSNVDGYSDYFSPIGEYSSTWNSKLFKDYDGEVVLTKAKYNLMYNHKNIIIIINNSENSNGDARGFVLSSKVLDEEDIFSVDSVISINKADYKLFEGCIILKNREE